MHRSQIQQLQQEIADYAESHEELKASAASSSSALMSKAQMMESRTLHDSDRLREVSEEKELLTDELQSLKAMLRDTMAQMAQSEINSQAAGHRQEKLEAAASDAERDSVEREDMYRSQIQQLQQENRHIQEMLLSRHEDPVDERGAVPDEDKVHLQQELSALKSLLKEQSARIAEASEASNKRVEAVSLEKREAMAATESMAQQHARDVRLMQEEIDHAARLLAEHELEAESSREAAVHQSREQARALAEAVALAVASAEAKAEAVAVALSAAAAKASAAAEATAAATLAATVAAAEAASASVFAST